MGCFTLSQYWYINFQTAEEWRHTLTLDCKHSIKLPHIHSPHWVLYISSTHTMTAHDKIQFIRASSSCCVLAQPEWKLQEIHSTGVEYDLYLLLQFAVCMEPREGWTTSIPRPHDSSPQSINVSKHVGTPTIIIRWLFAYLTSSIFLRPNWFVLLPLAWRGKF